MRAYLGRFGHISEDGPAFFELWSRFQDMEQKHKDAILNEPIGKEKDEDVVANNTSTLPTDTFMVQDDDGETGSDS
jgi:hypothetical protein